MFMRVKPLPSKCQIFCDLAKHSQHAVKERLTTAKFGDVGDGEKNNIRRLLGVNTKWVGVVAADRIHTHLIRFNKKTPLRAMFRV